MISHDHYDHCGLDALITYPDKSVPFAVVPGLAKRVRAAGFPNVTELAPRTTVQILRTGQSFEV